MTDTVTQKSETDVSDDKVETEEDLWKGFDDDDVSAGADDIDEGEDPDGDEGQADDDDGKDTADAKEDTKTGEGDGDGSDDLDLTAMREQNERLETQFRSEQNRSIGQQRRADRLQKRVNELESKLAAAKKSDTSAEEREALDKIREEYPDIVGPILSRMDKMESDKPDIDASLSDAKEELKDIEAGELAKFQAEHTDGFSVIRDNAELFREWVQDQPKQYRDIYERNRANLVDGVGAALLVSRFKGDLQEARQGGEVDEHRETSNKLTTRRAKQLSGATTQKASAKTTKIVQDDPTSSDDPESEWKYWDRVEKRKSS